MIVERPFTVNNRLLVRDAANPSLLDVTIIQPVSRFTLLQMFPKLAKGTHVGHPMLRTVRGRSVRIESPGITAYADGERIGPLPLTATCVPGALTLLC